MNKTMTVLLIAVVLSVNIGCNRKGEHGSTKQQETVIIAVSPQPVSAPLYVAFEKGFFEREGLRVTLQSYTSGKDALNAVIGGKAHLGTAAETPVMIAGLKGEKIYVIATLAESDKYMRIIARKDRGISIPADLKGKKIGVSPGTNGEFFLHAYLTVNHLAKKDVQAVDVLPKDMVDALVTGKVDAVSTWVPHTTTLQHKLGSNALIIDDHGIYVMTWNVAATQDFVKSHPAQIENFLRAVLRANKFIKERPDEARAITAKHIGMDMPMLSETWDLYGFNTVLNQSLILSLEDQARWMIKKEAGSARRTPNFVDFVYADGLKTVRPEAVSISGK